MTTDPFTLIILEGCNVMDLQISNPEQGQCSHQLTAAAIGTHPCLTKVWPLYQSSVSGLLSGEYGVSARTHTFSCRDGDDLTPKPNEKRPLLVHVTNSTGDLGGVGVTSQGSGILRQVSLYTTRLLGLNETRLRTSLSRFHSRCRQRQYAFQAACRRYIQGRGRYTCLK